MDYAGLKTAIASWMHRSDVAAVADDFIDLAEAFLSRNVRHPYMEARATATASSGWVAIPSDYMEIRELSYGGNPLQLAANEVCQEHDTDSGDPRYYCVTDAQFRIAPASSTATEVEIVYLASIPALSDSNTSNWLLEEASDLYLMACLAQASVWARDADMLLMAKEQVAIHLAEVNARADRIRYGDAPLTVIARGHS